MINIIAWAMFFIAIGILYITLLYYFHLRNKDEKRRISEKKVEEDLYMNKNWRDSYVLNKDVDELDKELERLKGWGIMNQ